MLAPGREGVWRRQDHRRTHPQIRLSRNPGHAQAVEAQHGIAGDLSAAAHLIHASSEGRFTITWCPGHLTQQEIEGVGFNYGNLDAMLQRYDPEKLNDGYNTIDGEQVFFISNPGLGLWAHRSRL